MNEKKFMKQVAEYNMPDILEVKESCMEQLKEGGEGQYKQARFQKAAAITVIAMVVICLCVSPVNSLANQLVQHIKTVLNLNEEPVELGDVNETNIRIPDDCEEVQSDGVTYLTKAYNTLSDLTKDIQTDIYAWVGEDDFFDDGIMLNVVQNDYGRITLLYDVTKNEVLNEDDDSVDLKSVDIFVYFPLSSKTSLGDIMLQNEQLEYGTIDEEGNIEKYKQNTEYQLLEQYESANLGTTITVISSKTDTEGDGDLGDVSDSDVMYYLYFTLEGMCYQINCDGTLDKAHEVIENIKKTNAADSLSSENSESNSSDLLYRTTDRPSISLEKGEKINLSVMNGKEYDGVTISLLGKDMTHKIGSLNENTPYTYLVDVSGEYVIYAGKKHENITDEIVVEHLCNAADNLHPID